MTRLSFVRIDLFLVGLLIQRLLKYLVLSITQRARLILVNVIVQDLSRSVKISFLHSLQIKFAIGK